MKLSLGSRAWIRAGSTHADNRSHIEVVVVGFRAAYTEYDEFPENDEVFLRDDATNHVYQARVGDIFPSLEAALRDSIADAQKWAIRAADDAARYRLNIEAWGLQLDGIVEAVA